MNKTHQEILAELIHKELLKLPEHQAPANLIPDVLKSIEERKRCWWKQAWTEWPFTARMLLLPAALACGGALLLVLRSMSKWQLMDHTANVAGNYLHALSPLLDLVATLSIAAMLALQSLEQSWIIGAASVVFMMYLSCVALGTACFRVAAQRH